jgi:tripartite-type tricarboxylate transporter receptor subunit TctC
MKNMTAGQIRTIIMMLAFLTVLAAFPGSLLDAAVDYPNKPVRLIIPWPPGGSNDYIARPIAAKLSERLGQQVFVDNRGGAGGVIGTEVGAKAAPDGYMLTFIGAAYTLYAPLQDKLPFDPHKAFTPVAGVGSGPNVLVVHPSFPGNSVKELIAQAKQKPGELIFVSVGRGSSLHMGAELFKIMADIDVRIVQFKGGGPAMIDLLGGHSHAFISSLIAALPHIKSGKLKALGTGGKVRSSALPDVPTIAEAGVPGYETGNWWGIVAPAGTPAPIVTKLSNEIKAVLATDDIKMGLQKYGIEVDYSGPEEFGKVIEKETANWTRVVKKANIKLDN